MCLYVRAQVFFSFIFVCFINRATDVPLVLLSATDAAKSPCMVIKYIIKCMDGCVNAKKTLGTLDENKIKNLVTKVEAAIAKGPGGYTKVILSSAKDIVATVGTPVCDHPTRSSVRIVYATVSFSHSTPIPSYL